jgi:positive regulator of sigma E activity
MNIFDSVFTGASGETALSLPWLLSALGTAFALGFLISIVYSRTHKGKTPSQSFALTLVLLPAVVAVIILLIGNNVARAFSLAGAFSIIRFRSAPGDPKDITYVLFSMATGLAAGMGFLLYAAVIGIALCAVMALLEVCGYGKRKATERLLKITVPENLNFKDAFERVLQKYTLSADLRKIRTADLGSVFELNYAVTLREGIDEKEFIDELRKRNGNMNIILILDVPASAEF